MELDGSVPPDYTFVSPEGHTHWVDQAALDDLIDTRKVFADVVSPALLPRGLKVSGSNGAERKSVRD